jgi:hypothetical protein
LPKQKAPEPGAFFISNLKLSMAGLDPAIHFLMALRALDGRLKAAHGEL